MAVGSPSLSSTTSSIFILLCDSNISSVIVYYHSTVICQWDLLCHHLQPIAIWADISSFSILNRWSSSPGPFYHVLLKRDQIDWDWRLRLNVTPNAIGCTTILLSICGRIFYNHSAVESRLIAEEIPLPPSTAARPFDRIEFLRILHWHFWDKRMVLWLTWIWHVCI